MSKFYIDAVIERIQAALDDEWDDWGDLDEDGQRMDNNAGICELVDTACLNADYSICDDISDALKRCFEAWPNFSGSTTYPVPAPLTWKVPDNWSHASGEPTEILRARGIYQQTTNVWEGAYGEIRRELAVFIIENIEEKYNAVTK